MRDEISIFNFAGAEKLSEMSVVISDLDGIHYKMSQEPTLGPDVQGDFDFSRL